jgi:hypothetical protein
VFTISTQICRFAAVQRSCGWCRAAGIALSPAGLYGSNNCLYWPSVFALDVQNTSACGRAISASMRRSNWPLPPVTVLILTPTIAFAATSATVSRACAGLEV